MAARRMMLPDYGTVSMKGTQYYRTRVTDQQGRRVSLYARTREELYQKEQEAIQQIENKTYRRSTPILRIRFMLRLIRRPFSILPVMKVARSPWIFTPR